MSGTNGLTTTAVPCQLPANAVALPRTNQLAGLLTIIRDKNTARGDFIFYSDRIIRLLVEEGAQDCSKWHRVFLIFLLTSFAGPSFFPECTGLNHLPVVDKSELFAPDWYCPPADSCRRASYSRSDANRSVFRLSLPTRRV